MMAEAQAGCVVMTTALNAVPKVYVDFQQLQWNDGGKAQDRWWGPIFDSSEGNGALRAILS